MAEEPNWRRKLEADARAGRDAIAEVQALRERHEALETELALRRAGVNPDTPAGQMFARAYQGPLEPQAIQEAAYEVGILQNSGQSMQAQQAMQRISHAAAGGVASGAGLDFEAQLDSIPPMVNGQWNPNYVTQVLAATEAQAAREGRQFAVSSGQISFPNGDGPAVTPLGEK